MLKQQTINIADVQNYRKPQSTPVKPKARKPSGTGTTPKSSASNPDSTISFESASDIRNYIYQEWHQKKMATARQSLSERKRLEKEAQLKKEKV